VVAYRQDYADKRSLLHKPTAVLGSTSVATNLMAVNDPLFWFIQHPLSHDVYIS